MFLPVREDETRERPAYSAQVLHVVSTEGAQCVQICSVENWRRSIAVSGKYRSEPVSVGRRMSCGLVYFSVLIKQKEICDRLCDFEHKVIIHAQACGNSAPCGKF